MLRMGARGARGGAYSHRSWRCCGTARSRRHYKRRRRLSARKGRRRIRRGREKKQEVVIVGSEPLVAAPRQCINIHACMQGSVRVEAKRHDVAARA